MICKFCEAMKEKRQIEKIVKGWRADDLEDLGEYMFEYTVAIVTRNWYRKRGRRSASRTTDYRHLGLGYALNFCPECGRKL